MKRNTFFKLLAGFAAGLIICGIGAGVCVMEITSLRVAEASEELSSQEKEYTLPDGEKLYIDGWRSNINIIQDDNIPAGTMKIIAEYTGDTEISFNDIEDVYLCEKKSSSTFDDDDIEDEIEARIEKRVEERMEKYFDENGYEYDEDEFEDEDDEDDEDENDEENTRIVRHRVKGLYSPDYIFADNDWDEFRQMLEHLKKRQIYIPSNETANVKILINPADNNRVVGLWTKKSSGKAWFEEAEIFTENEDAAQAEPQTAKETAATETTVEATTATAAAAHPTAAAKK